METSEYENMKESITSKILPTEEQVVVCEKLGWSISLYSNSVDLINWSPDGENLVFYITDKSESFCDGVRKIYDDFDIDEHAALRLLTGNQGKNGVKLNFTNLVRDSREIKYMLFTLWTALEMEKLDKEIPVAQLSKDFDFNFNLYNKSQEGLSLKNVSEYCC